MAVRFCAISSILEVATSQAK
uniref:Uncharacterized protein n=1 Tax=Anguilla anguilla TaxID=7936 RepID=A0A0E9PJH7_ANGAN